MKYLIAFCASVLFALPTQAMTWQDIYNGYGVSSFDGSSWTLSPAPALSPEETHASLVASQETLSGDYEVSLSLIPLAQLRQNSAPNPWETGWVLFGYQPNGSFKYLLLKPDGYGVELGEFDPTRGQHFLYTSSVGAFSFPIGAQTNLVLRVESGVITATANGVSILSYAQKSDDWISTNGALGFYAEDAQVVFGPPTITSLVSQSTPKVGFKSRHRR